MEQQKTRLDSLGIKNHQVETASQTRHLSCPNVLDKRSPTWGGNRWKDYIYEIYIYVFSPGLECGGVEVIGGNWFSVNLRDFQEEFQLEQQVQSSWKSTAELLLPQNLQIF